MFKYNFKCILDLINTFSDELSCVNFLEEQRWNGKVISPFDSSSKVWKCKEGKYRCANTGKYFNVKTGTLFENTKIPLQKWFIAIWLMTSHKKGISSIQLAKDIGVTQKTAWFIAQRIRVCFCLDPEPEMSNIVEADETFVGGKNKNRHKDKKVPFSTGRSFKDKTPVLGLLERGGNIAAYVVKDTKASTLQPILRSILKPETILLSDEWLGYKGMRNHCDHYVVDHGKKQYVDYDNPEIHTNTIEGFWGILKRGIIGIYNWISRKHLQLYVEEFVFRYNTRKIKESERFILFLHNFTHRLKYKDLIFNQ
ncbi:IS1595 family transposase [Flavobacterium sp.]|uniref:IS1595 family transposase n=1 Tax=Flavobacterium sp. TaxID=239 RepID=UPI003A8E150B